MPNTQYDVAILGGGLAGLTLALQLRQRQPDISMVVIDKATLPYPAAAHKVGESTSELGSLYLTDLLGSEYLEKHQIRKAGLRFFFSAGDNDSLASRAEYGTNHFLPIAAYQLDRGLLENEMWAKVEGQGTRCLSGCKLERVDKGEHFHTVYYQQDDAEHSAQARWLVDATGRSAFLKTQFGLNKRVDHEPSASWFRIAERIDIDEWSDDPAWKARIEPNYRWRATNHLLGPGYWVWIIPLVSGSTSIGIVAAPEYHDFKDFNTFERTMEWLQANEPMCANYVNERLDKVQDFGAVRHFALGSERVFSTERWALTGEAGVFVDPFLSPGTDFIAISNQMVTDMVCRDLADEPFEEYTEFMNDLYLNLFELLLGWFKKLYPVYDKDQALMLWIGWYFALYMSVPVSLSRYKRIADIDFMKSIDGHMKRWAALSVAGIRLLSEWAHNNKREPTPEFRDICSLEHIVAIQHDLLAHETRTDEEVRELLDRHLGLLETTVVEYHKLLAEDAGDDAINPYALSGMPVDAFPGIEQIGSASSEEIASNIRRIWFSSEM